MILFCTICLIFCSLLDASAQQPILYAAVYTNNTYVVGAGNPRTGLFYRSPEDSAWIHTGAPNIRAFDIGVHVSSGDRTLYVAAGNGLHRSTDAGYSWKIVTDWRVTEVLSVAVDRTNGLNLYISTPYGIWRSMDGGDNWSEINRGLRSAFVSRVIIDAANPSRLFCASESGIYESRNAGDSWSRTPGPAGGVRIILQHPRHPHVLGAGTEEEGLFLSSDYGATWRSCIPDSGQKTIYSLAFDPTDHNHIYAAGFHGGVHVTRDGGMSWTRSISALDGCSVHALAVNARNPGWIFAATLGKGVYMSVDAARTWAPYGLDGAKIWSILLVQP